MSEQTFDYKTTYGKMQLDSAIDEVTKEPLYPSIILSQVNCDLATIRPVIGYDFDESILTYKGTEIFNYLKSMPGFLSQCIEKQTTGGDVVFEIPAFVDDYTLWIRLSFTSIAVDQAINLSANIRNRNEEGSPLIFNYNGFGVGDDVSNLYDLFNTSNAFELYIAINPYSEDTDNIVMVCRIISDENDLNNKRYLVAGNCSEPDLTVERAKFNAHDIITRIFRNHIDPIEEIPVGTYEYLGKNERNDIEQPDTPTSSILVGMHNMYKLNATELLSVSKALWSIDFYDNLLKIFNDPMESIVSLALCPLEPEVYETPVPIVVGNVELKYTPISQFDPIACTGLRLAKQYSQYNCGDIILYEEYRNYLDYNTKVEIYLPFIGIQTLNVEDVMNAKLTLKYNVDFFTGDCVAYLHCYRPDGTLDSTLYQWDGNILCNVPVSASNYSQTIMTGINTVVGLAGAKSLTSVIGGAAGMLGAMKPDIEKGGSMGSTKGALGIFEPHLIITKQIEDKPDNYEKLKGKPDNTTLLLEKGLGLVIADSIHIKGINATQEEKDELESLFKSGVIL